MGASSQTGFRTIVLDEEWKSERLLNVFRTVVWLGGGVFGTCAGLLTAGRVNPGALVTLVWGAACGLYGLLYLRRRFHRAAPLITSTMDLAVLVLAMDMVYPRVVQLSPARGAQVLYGTATGIMVLIGTNAIRFSPLTVIWTVVAGAGAYAALLLRHGAFTFRFILDVFMFAASGSLMAYSTIKLRRIVRRVKERDAFARFLPGPAVDRLTRDPLTLDLGGEEDDATVLFADIRDFTSLSSGMKPAGVVALLNEYFEQMVDEIFRHDG
ncbi:MAG TPA: adenylate/guanylate cyclase domain-containing protein, partial [Planctomycetota bacterium]|nr:adenylate/guanylate cyclase domain-containing protein [Planctomycetota bacterium]